MCIGKKSNRIITKQLVFTTGGSSLDLQANDILFASLYQYDDEGELSLVSVDFDTDNPAESCYVTYDSKKPLYAKLDSSFHGLNYYISEDSYQTLVNSSGVGTIVVPDYDDVVDLEPDFNEIYVINGLDVNNTELLLELDVKHSKLYLDLLPFTSCNILIDLRNIKCYQDDSSQTQVKVVDEYHGFGNVYIYKNYVYTSYVRFYNKPTSEKFDVMYKSINGISSLSYVFKLKFTDTVVNDADFVETRNTPSYSKRECEFIYSFDGSSHSFYDIGKFMVELVQYSYDGVREVCTVNQYTSAFTCVYDSSRPLYAEGIPESNYFNQTLKQYGLAQFTIGLYPPYPCVVDTSDSYDRVNMNTSLTTLVVNVKALPYVSVKLDMTGYADLGSTVSTKIQLDGYYAWTSYKPSTTGKANLLLAFLPSSVDEIRYFDVSVKLSDGSYQLYNRYSFNANVDYNNYVVADVVE